MTNRPDDSISSMMKNAINYVVLGVLGWLAMTTQESTKQIAVMQNTLGTIQDQLKDAKGNPADRYTASAAAADFRSRDALINQNTNRVEDHERRLRDLEIRFPPRAR